MTSPNPLIPNLDGRRISVDAAIQNPTILRNRIGKLTAEQIILDKFFTPLGERVAGRALVFSVPSYSDLFTTPIEERTPGAEYRSVEASEPTPRMVHVGDRGGWFEIDDTLRRNTVAGADYLDSESRQLSNRIAASLDESAMAAIADSDIASVAILGNWSALKTVGPLDQLTESADLPTAHLSQAVLEFDLERMGIKPDLMIVNPTQHHELRVAFGDRLGDVLASTGLDIFAHMLVPENTVYVVQRGQVGVVAFDQPLTVSVTRFEERRTTRVTAFVEPAIGVTRPFAAKRLVLA